MGIYFWGRRKKRVSLFDLFEVSHNGNKSWFFLVVVVQSKSDHQQKWTIIRFDFFFWVEKAIKKRVVPGIEFIVLVAFCCCCLVYWGLLFTNIDVAIECLTIFMFIIIIDALKKWWPFFVLCSFSKVGLSSISHLTETQRRARLE